MVEDSDNVTSWRWLRNQLAHPVRTNIWILIIGVFLLSFYALVSHLGPTWTFEFKGLSLGGSALHVLAILSKELGLAAVVAVTLNFSIEAFNRKRHKDEQRSLLSSIKESHETHKSVLIDEIRAQHTSHIEQVNSKLFEVLYKRSIPEAIFREVEHQLLKCSFVRCESDYYYTLRWIDAEFASLHVRHVYTVQNISPVPEIYRLSIGFDVIRSMADKYSLTRLKNGQNQLLGNDIPIIVKQKSDHHEWWEASLESDVAAGATVSCEFEYVRVSNAKGKEAICTLLPAKRLSIHVMDPGERFALRAMGLHPRGEIDLSPVADKVSYHWVIDGALLPGQGMLFDWAPLDDCLASSAKVAVDDLLTSVERDTNN